MGVTFSTFIKNHLNKAMDYDHCAGAQCVDLIKYYLDEIYGIKAGAWGDAHCYYENYNNLPELKKSFTRIANTSEFVPKKGDIVVWSSKLSSKGWGHIAIATGEGTTTWFTSYDQNWTGNHDACVKIKHNYNHVLGVLRPKNQDPITGLKTLDSSGFKRGDVSLGVYALKQRLIALGYSMKSDSGFGAGTEKAVNAFLKKWGYKQTGIAGEKFIKNIMKSSKYTIAGGFDHSLLLYRKDDESGTT